MQNHRGHSTRRWRAITANLKAQRNPCHLCGQPIDYEAASGTTPDSFEADHIKPRSTHPHLAEDPYNVAASHKRCNGGRGNRAPALNQGMTSQDW